MAGVPAGLLNRGKAPLPKGLLSPPDERGLLNRFLEDTITGQALKSLYGAATLPGDVYSGEQPVYAVNPETGEVEIAPGMVERSADLAGSVTLGAGTIPAEANAMRMGIKAYHGSPHDFDKFSSEKIGTGEGAQVFGRGLYFAENPTTAEFYKESLSAPKFPTLAYDKRGKFWELLDFSAGDGKPTLVGKFKTKKEAAAKTDELLSAAEAAVPKGKTYEVDIAGEPEQFINWDRTPAEQSPAIRDAVVARGVKPNDTRWHNSLMNTFMGTPEGGSGSYDDLNRAATDFLKDQGVKGARYLDQGSRLGINPETAVYQSDNGEWGVMPHWRQQFPDLSQTFETREEALKALRAKEDAGSRNIVVFDDQLISILRKYGLPITAGGVATLSQMAPEQARASQIPQAPPRGGGW